MDAIVAQRKQALTARRRLSPAERRKYSLDACRRVARLPVFRRARHIGFYWPLASEADPCPLFEHLAARQTAYLPRVDGQRLSFVAVNPRRFRHRHSSLGIVEPLAGPDRRVQALDLLVMPLAAFDRYARRIGLGGGFYDRTLAHRRKPRSYRRPVLLGLAFEAQRVADIAPQPWDVPLDLLVTESQIHRFATSAATLGQSGYRLNEQHRKHYACATG